MPTTRNDDGIDIFYEDSGGDGPALLFSHGFLMDHTMFDPQVAALSDRFRCIRWDERGFGATAAPGPFSYYDSASDAVAVLDACGVSEAVWIGMSQGGYLSLRAALRHPERMRALVLIDSQAHADPPEAVEGYRAMLEGMLAEDDEVFMGTAQVVAGMILGDDELSAEWVPKWAARRANTDLTVPGETLLGRDDISGQLGSISCPSLVFHGTSDEAIPLELGQFMADNLGDCRGFITIEGAAHAPNLSHPDLVNPPLLNFLNELG